MKSLFTYIAIALVVIVGFIFLSNSNVSSPSTDYLDGDGSEYEEEFSYDEAIENYWDEIKSYVSTTDYISACSDSSGNCYDLEADISEGCVETIYFDNGGNLDFSDACFDESGYAYDSDEEGNGWEFELDMSSPTVSDSVDEWRSDREVEDENYEEYPY